MEDVEGRHQDVNGREVAQRDDGGKAGALRGRGRADGPRPDLAGAMGTVGLPIIGNLWRTALCARSIKPFATSTCRSGWSCRDTGRIPGQWSGCGRRECNGESHVSFEPPPSVLRSAGGTRPPPYARHTRGSPFWCWPADVFGQQAPSAEWSQR